MSEQTRGKLSNQNCWKWSLCLCRRLITISLCSPFLSVFPIIYLLYRSSPHIGLLSNLIFYLTRITLLIFGAFHVFLALSPNTQLHRNCLNCERHRKHWALILTHHRFHQRFALSHCFPYHLLSLPRSLSDSVLSPSGRMHYANSKIYSICWGQK